MKIVHILSVLLLLVACFEIGHCQKRIREAEAKILKDLLAEGRYDRTIRPGGVNEHDYSNEPVNVKVNMFLRTIEPLDDMQMRWSAQVTFRQEWNDDRLKFSNSQIAYLTVTDPSKIWRPDTFFRNELQGQMHQITEPNELVRIYPNGDILYSRRISLTLSCPMDFKYYPFDKQDCSISLASYSYTEQNIKYIWKDVDPIQVTRNLALPRFYLVKYVSEDCTSTTKTGSYSCLNAKFTFQREFSYYLIQLYIPCTMMTLVSWTAFWFDGKKDITARTIISLTTLLIMACMISFANFSMPKTSYTKRVDVWTGFTLTFVFAALLQTATVNYIAKHKDLGEESRQYKLIKSMQSIHLDIIARIAFPLAFLLFIALYAVSIFI